MVYQVWDPAPKASAHYTIFRIISFYYVSYEFDYEKNWFVYFKKQKQF